MLLALWLGFEAFVAPPLALLKTSLYRNRTQAAASFIAFCTMYAGATRWSLISQVPDADGTLLVRKAHSGSV